MTALFYAFVLRRMHVGPLAGPLTPARSPDLRAARWTSAVPYAAMMITYVTATKLTTAANAILLQYSGTP